MNNVKMSVKGNKLTITMDITKFLNNELTSEDLSSTGKSYTVAGSNGFQKLEGDKLDGLNLSLNLNASRKVYDERQALLQGKQEARDALAEQAVTKVDANIANEFAKLGIAPSDLLEMMKMLKAMKSDK